MLLPIAYLSRFVHLYFKQGNGSTMKYQTITVDIINAIAIITLNRPKILNAYTVRMGEELVHAFENCKENDTVKSVILTGAGRAFCAGVDLNELNKDASQEDDLPALGDERFVRNYCEQLFNFPKPVIAAINGPAIGIGVTMTLPCDIRLASEGAKLGLPFAKMGIIPGLGSTFLLPKLLGLSQAKILALTGQPILSKEAQAHGLVDRIVPRTELIQEAISLAEVINENDPTIVKLIKEALNFGSSADSIAHAVTFEQQQNDKRPEKLQPDN